ncbi:hypothetical protein FA95DRAFT_1565866, partial [Auriscalpium vulgare]
MRSAQDVVYAIAPHLLPSAPARSKSRSPRRRAHAHVPLLPSPLVPQMSSFTSDDNKGDLSDESQWRDQPLSMFNHSGPVADDFSTFIVDNNSALGSPSEIRRRIVPPSTDPISPLHRDGGSHSEGSIAMDTTSASSVPRAQSDGSADIVFTSIPTVQASSFPVDPNSSAGISFSDVLATSSPPGGSDAGSERKATSRVSSPKASRSSSKARTSPDKLPGVSPKSEALEERERAARVMEKYVKELEKHIEEQKEVMEKRINELMKSMDKQEKAAEKRIEEHKEAAAKQEKAAEKRIEEHKEAAAKQEKVVEKAMAIQEQAMAKQEQ